MFRPYRDVTGYELRLEYLIPFMLFIYIGNTFVTWLG